MATTLTENHSDFIDISKGFHRISNVPGFAEEIYNNYTDAVNYAKKGAYGGTSFPGQTIRVVPLNSVEEPKLYIVDWSYNLVSITDSVSTDSKLSTEFSYSSYSGSSAIAITVPAGFILNTISIKINQPFKNENAVSIGVFSDNPDEPIFYYVTGPDVENSFGNYLVTDEEDSEFVFKFTESMPEQTTFYVFLKRVTDPNKQGTGILKIN